MQEHRRRLPHWDAAGVPVFVTWRLHGSLPAERVFHKEHLSSGEVFVAWDRLLDAGSSGPLYLRQPEIACIVLDQLHKLAAEELCALHAFVVMPNHVHALWTPQISLPELMRRIKGPTAYQANRLLGRSAAFWQQEYFDRMVRNREEFNSIQRYIEWNPVKAGLAGAPEDFPYSSAAGLKPRAG